MIDSNLNELFLEIKDECLRLIYQKRIDLDDLSYQMGMSMKTLYNFLKSKNEDFSVYLKLYEILLEW